MRLLVVSMLVASGDSDTTVVDNMRESIHALRLDFLCLLVPSRYTASRPGRGKPVLINILACSRGFHVINLECSTC